jgi:dihydroorotase
VFGLCSSARSCPLRMLLGQDGLPHTARAARNMCACQNILKAIAHPTSSVLEVHSRASDQSS